MFGTAFFGYFLLLLIKSDSPRGETSLTKIKNRLDELDELQSNQQLCRLKNKAGRAYIDISKVITLYQQLPQFEVNSMRSHRVSVTFFRQ